MLAQTWWEPACPRLSVGGGSQDRASSKKPEPMLQNRAPTGGAGFSLVLGSAGGGAGGGTRWASLMKGGGSLCTFHWGPCAHSIPVDAHGEGLSLVGLGGPAVSGWLPAEVPQFGHLPECPFAGGTGHSPDARGGWLGGTESPPHE